MQKTKTPRPAVFLQIDEKHGKSAHGSVALKRWQYASIFDCYHTWKKKSNEDKTIVKPWRAKAGMIVTLSAVSLVHDSFALLLRLYRGARL